MYKESIAILRGTVISGPVIITINKIVMKVYVLVSHMLLSPAPPQQTTLSCRSQSSDSEWWRSTPPPPRTHALGNSSISSPTSPWGTQVLHSHLKPSCQSDKTCIVSRYRWAVKIMWCIINFYWDKKNNNKKQPWLWGVMNLYWTALI